MSNWIAYNEPQTEELQLPFPGIDNVQVLVRREYQNHPEVSGNKWWKLKYNLSPEITRPVMTFGGAFSNHIYATAAACKALGLNSVGVIRGEEVVNETLSFVKTCGMKLHFVSRENYRKKYQSGFQQVLQAEHGECLIIPEGGTNQEAIRGCEELGHRLLSTPFDYLMLPVGTGGTIAGIINAFSGERKIIGIPVLKNADFLNDEIQRFLSRRFDNWKLYLDYHHGGYAKTNPELNQFIKMLADADVPTEFVYTGKLFWAAIDLIRKKIIEPGSTVLVLHTGGLRNH